MDDEVRGVNPDGPIKYEHAAVMVLAGMVLLGFWVVVFRVGLGLRGVWR